MLDQRWFKLLEPIGAMLLPIPNGLSNLNSWLRNQNIDTVIFTGCGDLNLEYLKNNISNVLASPEFCGDMANAREMVEMVF